jgi:hypothetical protein
MEATFAMIVPLERGHSPVDPGFGGGIGAAHPGHDLPGSGAHPWVPGMITGPLPPPGVWGPPPRPEHGLPPVPPGGYVDAGLPVYPAVPIYPAKPPAGSTLPELPPGSVYPPLPPELGTEKVIALVVIFGVGYRWAVLDLGLQPGAPGHPISGVPPTKPTVPTTPQPK